MIVAKKTTSFYIVFITIFCICLCSGKDKCNNETECYKKTKGDINEKWEDVNIYLEYKKAVMTVPKITKARRNHPRIPATIPEVIMRSPSIPVNLREYDKGLHIAGPSTFQVTSDNFLHECTKQFNKENLSIEKQAHCKARSMVVHLHTDEGEVKPSAILTKYCSGSCKMGRVCKATQTANKTISVQILWYSGKESMCRTVLIPEDRKCKCVCSQNKSSCTAQQKFNKKICQCECQNENERLHCEKKANKMGLHEWDDQTCSCVCRQETPCSTGTSWEKRICACSKLAS